MIKLTGCLLGAALGKAVLSGLLCILIPPARCFFTRFEPVLLFFASDPRYHGLWQTDDQTMEFQGDDFIDRCVQCAQAGFAVNTH